MTPLAFAADRRAAAVVWIWIESRPRLLQMRRAAVDHIVRRCAPQQTRRMLLQRAKGTDRRSDRRTDGHSTVTKTLPHVMRALSTLNKQL